MEKIFRSLSLAIALLWGASSAHAVVLTNTDAGAFTANETFVFSFNVVPQSSGAGTFLMRARGDFICCTGGPTGISSTGEILNWNIDGLASGVGFNTALGASLVIQADVNDQLGEQSFSIDAATMAAITADGSVTMTLQVGPGVDIFHSTDFVTASLTFDTPQIPEPGTLALMALGLAGIGFRYRRGS